MAELPAVLEGVGVLRADGERGGVHVGAVSQRHLVSTLVWGNVGTFLVRVVVTVGVSVTQVVLGHAAAVVAGELVAVAAARDLITVIAAVVVAVTHVSLGYTAAVRARELARDARAPGAAGLVTTVLAVTVAITLPAAGDTLTVTALELVALAAGGAALFLVTEVQAVVVAVARVVHGHAVSVVTLEPVPATPRATVLLVKSPGAVVLTVTMPGGVNAALRTRELKRLTHYGSLGWVLVIQHADL